MLTWDGIVTKFHKQHVNELEIPSNIEAYILQNTLQKTLESISLDYRRGEALISRKKQGGGFGNEPSKENVPLVQEPLGKK